MVKFDKEMEEYINEYYKSLEKSEIEGNKLYLRVLENALELANNEEQFKELLSFGNEYISKNVRNIKRIPQFKYNLKTLMKKKLETLDNEQEAFIPYTENEFDPYEIYEKKDMIKVVLDALDGITDTRRNAIEKAIIEDLTYREAAKECNCGHDTIRKRINEGLFYIKTAFPVLYYRYYDNEEWTSFLEKREQAKELKLKK